MNAVMYYQYKGHKGRHQDFQLDIEDIKAIQVNFRNYSVILKIPKEFTYTYYYSMMENKMYLVIFVLRLGFVWEKGNKIYGERTRESPSHETKWETKSL